MSTLTNAPGQPLTLGEQLNAMLLGWLDRRASRRGPGRPELRARAVVIVAASAVDEVARFCADWGIAVDAAPHDDDRWAVLSVEGPALPVEGFTEITSMYRR
jgi:hypothetical protein